MNDIINILGINVSTLKKSEIIGKIKWFLANGGQHQIITPNPEFILAARKDEEFFYILNSSGLAVPDGIGLKFAALAMGKKLYRFAGADLAKEILKIAEEKNLKVGIVNWDKALSKKEDIENNLKREYPKLKFIAENVNRQAISYKLKAISYEPDILFCTLGAPWQEKFIYHNLKNLPSVKIAIGVGGAFDFLTKKIKRAPNFLRTIGLEWLWRLILEPKYRFKRIYNAVIVFPCVFIKWRFILPFLYRSNVACILFKKEGGRYKILLVQRSDQENHWQLPQGGTDGDSMEDAGRKELREELGVDKFKVIKVYKNLYKYKFGDALSKFKVSKKMMMGYRGQKQGLCVAEFFGSDNDIKINFWDHKNWKWVDEKDLINEVHHTRREAVEIFMEKFKNLSVIKN